MEAQRGFHKGNVELELAVWITAKHRCQNCIQCAWAASDVDDIEAPPSDVVSVKRCPDRHLHLGHMEGHVLPKIAHALGNIIEFSIDVRAKRLSYEIAGVCIFRWVFRPDFCAGSMQAGWAMSCMGLACHDTHGRIWGW